MEEASPAVLLSMLQGTHDKSVAAADAPHPFLPGGRNSHNYIDLVPADLAALDLVL